MGTKDEIEVQQTKSESTVDSEPKTPVAKPLTAGQVKITVFKANDIEKKGMFGRADPYVKLTLNNQKAKSATVKNNHNPVWNFEAIFNISDKTSENLNLAIFDDDIGKDHSLGSAVIDLRKLQEQQLLLNQWITLDKCNSGEVLVSAEFIPMCHIEKPAVSPEPQVINVDEKATTVEKTNTEIVSHEKRIDIASEVGVDDKKANDKGAKGLKDKLSKEKEGVEGDKKGDKVLEDKITVELKPLEAGDISINVHKARDIEKKGMMGKADPYVVILYGDQKVKSKTIKNNHNPEWEYTANFHIKPENADSISISVFDEDFGKDDTLGSTTLDLRSVQEYKSLKNQWIPLQNCKSGEVLVTAEFLPLSDIKKESEPIQKRIDVPEQIVEESKAQKIPEIKDKKIDVPSNEKTVVSSEKKPLDRGQIYITIFKAKDIEKNGMFGKADPYVTLSMGKQKAKSTTVKNSNNPEWNYKAAFDVDETTPHEINISVFDEDVGKDDSLGNAVLDISSIQEKSQLINQWIHLSNCKSGEILVSAEFVQQGKIVDYLRSQSEGGVKESIPVEVKEASDIKPKEISSGPEKVITKDEIEVQQTKSESTVDSELKTLVKKPLTAGQVKITVFKAKDIEKKRMFGKADPYVKLTLDNQKAKSATVKNNHNPEWNFEAIFN